MSLQDHVVSEAWSQLLSDIKYHLRVESPRSWIREVVKIWADRLTDRLGNRAIVRFRDGVTSTGVSRWEHDLTEELVLVQAHVHKFVQRLGADVAAGLDRIDPQATNRQIMSVLDISMNRVDAIYVTELRRAYNFGRLTGLGILGVEQFRTEITHAEACDECRHASVLTQNLTAATINQVPPHHPFCRCDLVPMGEN